MDFLKTLGIEARNPGAHSGIGWSKATDTDVLDVHNPATGELIAQVNVCTEQDYETVVENAQAAFDEWRTVPAPRRGEMVRLITEELRAKKDAQLFRHWPPRSDVRRQALLPMVFAKSSLTLILMSAEKGTKAVPTACERWQAGTL